MIRCSICNKKIQETFLGKIKGTYKKEKGKLEAICSECQKKM